MVSEAFYVYSVMERMALSRPEIVFKYIVDGALKFATPGTGKLLDAIYAVLGKDFADKTVPVDTKEDRIHVYGYVGTPENTRGNTNLQLFFINHRFVKSKQPSRRSSRRLIHIFLPIDFPAAFCF